MKEVSLCIGTAQFGMRYGITNKKGKVGEREIGKIFNLAMKNGIKYIDTAPAYGQAEEIIGRMWPTSMESKIISKVPPGSNIEEWDKNLMKSMQNLKTKKLDGYLIHRTEDLKGSSGFEMMTWIKNVREKGLVDRIGISIYDEEELEGLPLSEIQLVQLPLSVYDQRMIKNGVIDKLSDNGIAVHARSVMLQGLLVQEPNNWPSWVSKELKRHHMRWMRELEDKGKNLLEGALEFVKYCEGIEAVLVGVLSEDEMKQIIKAWNSEKKHHLENTQEWSWENMYELDPRKWRK